VRTAGLEPAWACAREILSLLCIPIPPRPHLNETYFSIKLNARVSPLLSQVFTITTMSNATAKKANIKKDSDAPIFDDVFRANLEELIKWRRDVRRFVSDPVDESLINKLIGLAALAPSVGNSQPWRFVKVKNIARRSRIIKNFENCNDDALGDYRGDKAKLYASLKLSGLRDAPVHLAVFCDALTLDGHGVGQKTMPETLPYSVVGALGTLWLAARAHGIGMGWVSIINPDVVAKILDVPKGWSLIAYLCLGYPEEEHLDPELQRYGWQDRIKVSSFILER
jgi:5,6-dimethylbenzimidazole synthase